MATAQTISHSAAPERTNYPKKLFYRINEVAKIAGLKPHVLRYWETEFKELTPEKDRSDQRRYREKDVEMVLKIKGLLHSQRYTIAGARQFLRDERAGQAAASQEPARMAALRGIRSELSDLIRQLSV